MVLNVTVPKVTSANARLPFHRSADRNGVDDEIAELVRLETRPLPADVGAVDDDRVRVAGALSGDEQCGC